ncbi:FRG domain-containing protein [uncultured Paludibaculum sp.]|uniref:FRG domain-containing protein n=1 Tax=uncultured Paludibaculum sp. TaxID=1765020 RepID=UPI002AAB6FD1|nr:FRG domain-containing protein [uncultured Paludibaculum sp.]
MAKSIPPFCQRVHVLKDWRHVRDALQRFPPPALAVDEFGEISEPAWIFRGVGSRDYGLTPAIEREARQASLGWPALEAKLMEEFRFRAGLYLDLRNESDFELLATMQHYGVPTRLLDFTLSPLIALYFAIRAVQRTSKNGTVKFARVWAISSQVIREASGPAITQARAAQAKHDGRSESHSVSLSPCDAASDRDAIINDAKWTRNTVDHIIAADGAFRSSLNQTGCIFLAPPTSANARLAAQQGLFLLNGAHSMSFEESLKKVANARHTQPWCEAFDISPQIFEEIEKHLFQMNIHEQSLFPDVLGLAGFMNQRIRLHWS